MVTIIFHLNSDQLTPQKVIYWQLYSACIEASWQLLPKWSADSSIPLGKSPADTSIKVICWQLYPTWKLPESDPLTALSHLDSDQLILPQKWSSGSSISLGQWSADTFRKWPADNSVPLGQWQADTSRKWPGQLYPAWTVASWHFQKVTRWQLYPAWIVTSWHTQKIILWQFCSA